MAPDPKFEATVGGPITGWTAQLARKAQELDVRRVVAALTLEHLDPNGREKRIGSSGSVRLDRQKNLTGGGANLQIQLNGVDRQGGSTIGQVLVPDTVFTKARSGNKANVTEHLASRTRAALLESCRDGRTRTLLIRS